MESMPGISLPHGKRSSYVNGCHCRTCRAANAEYIRARRKTGSHEVREESVDASRAREYLALLSEMGIGRPSVHKACGVNMRILWEIANSKKAHILRSTEARILAITPNEAMSRGVLVDADVTRQQIKVLLTEGFTKSTLAARLKRFSDRLCILEGNKVRASSALKVNQLYRLMMADDERDDGICDAA
jgi:hypothetical protein